jgi:hypothetical protein
MSKTVTYIVGGIILLVVLFLLYALTDEPQRPQVQTQPTQREVPMNRNSNAIRNLNIN